MNVNRYNKKENIGRLDRRVTIQGYTENQNDFGEKEITFSDLATVWAKIEYQSKGTDEEFHAKRETAVTSVLFTIRYKADYRSKKNRIVYEGEVYDIISVRENGRRHYLIIEAKLKE
jgi:SPP1 family predicted phage head-tail adaptor